MSDCTTAFVNYLVDQTPHFDADVIRGINPTSGTWIGKVETRTWPSFAGNQHYFDRFTNVFPNPTREWTAKEYAACTGTPCDPDADQIGWGNIRQYYYKEERHIETPLLCFDQIRDVSHAKEHTAQLISNILRPATKTIMDYYIKKRSAQHAGTRWVASATMPAFNYVWVVGSGTNADNEIYIETDIAPTDICKIGPQMLQRRVTPLTLEGYMEQQVFEGFPRLIELITDIETVWDLDKQQTTGTTALPSQWRYTDWATVNNYWKYGFSGQLGNYSVSADPFPLRFIYLDARGSTYTYRYQLVLPYKNVDASTGEVYEGASFVSGTGQRMVRNDDFQTALYQFSFLHHRRAGVLFVADAEPVNPEMPFSSRNLAGEWKFANKELGCENIRGNKGKFYADFELAFKPEHPEWEELIFHKREPACPICVDVCDDNAQTGYPTQYYNSDNPLCDEGPWTTGETCGEEYDGVQVNTVEISGVTVALDVATKVCVADHAAIAVLLNADTNASLMGTWDTNDDGNLILDNPTVVGVNVVIDCCTQAQ